MRRRRDSDIIVCAGRSSAPSTSRYSWRLALELAEAGPGVRPAVARGQSRCRRRPWPGRMGSPARNRLRDISNSTDNQWCSAVLSCYYYIRCMDGDITRWCQGSSVVSLPSNKLIRRTSSKDLRGAVVRDGLKMLSLGLFNLKWIKDTFKWILDSVS